MPTTYAIPDGRTVMAATLYTGNGTSGRAISNAVNGVSFQPDFVWEKVRSNAYPHFLANSVAGPTKYLNSNNTDAETTDSGYFQSFNSTGFTIGSSGGINGSGETFVAWQWKAGGTAVSNTAGSITSTVSAGATQGFSVVTYTGNGTSGATVGHGLGVTPSMVILKSRSTATNWQVKHTSLNANQNLTLNDTSAVDTAPGSGYISAISSTTLTLLNGGSAITNVNGSGTTYVAYCFAAVAGYSNAFSYTGNGSTDGPFLYLGFRPRWIMIKQSSAAGEDWTIYDSSRNTYNSTNSVLYADTSSAEFTSTSYVPIDLLSNGFKIRTDGAGRNASGATYIGFAVAENPFKFANAR